MDSRVDQVIKVAITQTGGIEDIIKTIVGQVTQGIRRENDTLKVNLEDANLKIEWLESLMKNEEQDKVRALQTQRAHYLQIGGPDFQRMVNEQEMQKAKDVDEVALLEAQYLGDRSRGLGYAHIWAKMLSSAQVAQYVRANDAFPPSPYDVTATLRTEDAPPSARARSSTTMDPDARSFNPSHDSNAGSNKPPIDSLAVAPAPRVFGLRNPYTNRYDSPFFCPKCRKHLALNYSWDHYKNCKGPDAAVASLPEPHMPNVRAGLSTSHDLDGPITRRPESADYCLTRRAPGHSPKSAGTKSAE
ncbi:uncharacterized protein N0V89_006856 [Didymosphaeria variabile]|uniref:Uncharacterized protein n=1 Tax=Didymosphaeria variabile TaxID=1932322 RepID=A0A9W8XJY2_9PLEO|nr:uncharacterized protein N0V89_006856 [Didymosphaeria variabile]KAJ4351513.1 hypothetical protein N0V89_006856 [Didymosphaeria variabile]